MESKYYTPDISEFHVGFEYIINDNNLLLGIDREIININLSDIPDDTGINFTHPIPKEILEKYGKSSYKKGPTLELISQNINNIKVKYLDKDDIESLGFSETTTKQFIKNAPESLPYWTQVVIDFRWPEDITIIGKRSEEVGMLFRGAVRNISELRKVLKMVTYDLL